MVSLRGAKLKTLSRVFAAFCGLKRLESGVGSVTLDRMARSAALFLLLLLASCGGRPPAAAQSESSPEAELAAWRGRIDELDRELVALLNKRAGYVLELAPLKRQIGVQVQDSGREQIVLDNLAKANEGPLSDEAVQEIYRSIMAAMRDLQQ